jgi:hypothetical protein
MTVDVEVTDPEDIVKCSFRVWLVVRSFNHLLNSCRRLFTCRRLISRRRRIALVLTYRVPFDELAGPYRLSSPRKQHILSCQL